MKREGNLYTILYSVVLVVIVALGLAFTHQVLLGKQIANENIDKMQQLLRSLNVNVSADEAEQKYEELFTNAYLINIDGSKIEGTEGIEPEDKAFSTELTDPNKVGLPVYEVMKDNKKIYVVPMNGAGLWGAIWGYLAVEEDGSTIYGTDFGHASETPGLGAEIANSKFSSQFEGKNLIKDNKFVSVAVVKPGQSDSRRDYVDGISGGTITSSGVSRMFMESVGQYERFFMNLNNK